MVYKITVVKKPVYMHFISEGENTTDNTIQYLKDIYKVCAENNYKYVLTEERFVGNFLGTMDVYDVLSFASQE